MHRQTARGMRLVATLIKSRWSGADSLNRPHNLNRTRSRYGTEFRAGRLRNRARLYFDRPELSGDGQDHCQLRSLNYFDAIHCLGDRARSHCPCGSSDIVGDNETRARTRAMYPFWTMGCTARHCENGQFLPDAVHNGPAGRRGLAATRSGALRHAIKVGDAHSGVTKIAHS